MYEKFFSLRERPFDLTPNPRFLYLTAKHREALGNLQYGITSRKCDHGAHRRGGHGQDHAAPRGDRFAREAHPPVRDA